MKTRLVISRRWPWPFLAVPALATVLAAVGPPDACGQAVVQPVRPQRTSPVGVIFDTDMCTDCDDAGALAVLHELANRGECEILAVCCSNRSPYSVGACDAINTYFGRGDIPLGAYQGGDVGKDERLTKGYNEIARNRAAYGHDVVTRDGIPSAVSVYRKTLASQPDRSVTVISVGFLVNIADLLESGPDASSLLSGAELVAAKVKELAVMGGRYPQGQEYNFCKQGAAQCTKRAIEAWPPSVPVVFLGGEIGDHVLTGPCLAGSPAASPVRRAYELMYDGIRGRPSWDLMTVLYAVRGARDYWQVETAGHNAIREDGSNQWLPTPDRNHAYLKPRMPNEGLADVLSGLMSGGPRPR